MASLLSPILLNTFSNHFHVFPQAPTVIDNENNPRHIITYGVPRNGYLSFEQDKNLLELLRLLPHSSNPYKHYNSLQTERLRMENVEKLIRIAMTIAIVAMNLFGEGYGIGSVPPALSDSFNKEVEYGSNNKIKNSNDDIIDALRWKNTISTSMNSPRSNENDDLDNEIGVLMAYGGKLLRRLGSFALEFILQTPSTTSNEKVTGIAGKEPVIAATTPYLSTLSQPELENIGLKAVAAGTKPQKLQEAYVYAQTYDDWSKLEALISNALGEDAIKDQTVHNPIAGVVNLVDNLIGGKPSITKLGSAPNSPSVSSAPTYSLAEQNTGATSSTNGIMEKMSLVWNGDPTANPITQQNVFSRFVTAFKLENEALQIQIGINSLLKDFNSLLGKETSFPNSQGSTIQNKIDSPSVSESVVEVPVKDNAQSSLSDIFSNLPQTLGSIAIAAIKFVTPKDPLNDKVGGLSSGTRPPTGTVSEVRPLIDLEDPKTIVFGVAGLVAITSLAYALTTVFNSNEPATLEDVESRLSYYQIRLFKGNNMFTGFIPKLAFNNIIDVATP